MFRQLDQIPYFKGLSIEFFHRIFYKFERRYYEPDFFLLKEGDSMKELIIVENGELEVSIEFEGNRFVLANLKKGAMLNYRSIFLDDEMLVNVRSVVPTWVQVMDEKAIEKLMTEDEDLQRKIGIFQNALYRKGTSFPLDIIL
jgi:CRP-like cAMP-binding protein